VCKYCRGGWRPCALRGWWADDLAEPLGSPSPLQNGTVKSNAELVKLLNDADVPGTDVVGELTSAASARHHPAAAARGAERAEHSGGGAAALGPAKGECQRGRCTMLMPCCCGTGQCCPQARQHPGCREALVSSGAPASRILAPPMQTRRPPLLRCACPSRCTCHQFHCQTCCPLLNHLPLVH
jgi:hypothetical protein